MQSVHSNFRKIIDQDEALSSKLKDVKLIEAASAHRSSLWRRFLNWGRRFDRPFAIEAEARTYERRLETFRANAAYRIPFL